MQRCFTVRDGRVPVFVFLLALAVLVSSSELRAAIARYTAFAVSLGGPPVRSGATQLDIVIDRWTTKAEHDRLMQTLLEQGPEKLLSTLQSLPRVGYLRTPDSIAYDLKYANHETGEDGGERVVLMTDRHIQFWEAVNRPRTIDYPFTVAELRLNKDGEGEGKLSLYTRIVADKRTNTITLEDYGTQPVLLKNVKKVSSD